MNHPPRIDRVVGVAQWFWVVFVSIAIGVLYFNSKFSADSDAIYNYRCIYGCSNPPTSNRGLDFKDDSWFDPNSWFNPSYSQSYSDIDRVMRDQWQIGNRIYRTKDLMGRRI